MMPLQFRKHKLGKFTCHSKAQTLERPDDRVHLGDSSRRQWFNAETSSRIRTCKTLPLKVQQCLPEGCATHPEFGGQSGFIDFLSGRQITQQNTVEHSE